MVSAATAHAVRASISTPVRSTVSTWTSTSTCAFSMRKFTYTDPTRSGWHSGSRFGVCLAAWIPATRATASTSPLLMAPEAIFAAVSASISTRHRATARRWVTSLAVTSTMRARPSGSRCVNSEADMPRESRWQPCETRWSRGERAWREGGSAADLAHRAAGAHEVDLADAVAGPLGTDRAHDLVGEEVVELVVGRTAAEDGPQVELLEREQAGPQLALGGHADAVALLAERLGHAGDHADVADAVGVAEAFRRLDVFAVLCARNRELLQREHGVDP